jgi:hypothetical protein
MATKQDLQRAMWSIHFHRYFHPDARPVPPDFSDKVRPISLAEAVDILWNDAEAKRNEAHERTHDAEGVTPASLSALMRLYTAYELRGRYPDVFRPRFLDRDFPTGIFPLISQACFRSIVRRSGICTPARRRPGVPWAGNRGSPGAPDLPVRLNRRKGNEYWSDTGLHKPERRAACPIGGPAALPGTGFPSSRSAVLEPGHAG